MAKLNDTSINGKLDVTEDVNIGDMSVKEELSKLNSNLMIKQYNVPNVVFSNGYASGSFDITLDGYNAVGVIGFNMLTTFVAPVVLRINDNVLDWTVRHITDSSASGNKTWDNKINVSILYQKE